MSIRPFFWVLLALSCASVLIFAILMPTHAPAIMQVHLDSPQPRASEATTLTLHLTDPQGLPIEEAHIAPSANMTNMDMWPPPQSHVKEVGQGTYVAQLHLYMTGPWAITIMTHAPGFAPQRQTLVVEVV
jgi:hypothetical protein